nr:uncharacterized protein LOC107449507 [Parasteatoda tepidariorum]
MIFDPDLDIINAERRKTVVTSTNLFKGQIPLYDTFSSYRKMIRVTAWIYRFYRNIKSATDERNFEEQLAIEKMKDAEMVILKYVQNRCLAEETKPCYASLRTITDDEGLIRVRTRIAMRKDLRTFKYPIALPSDHNVTHCLILDKHKELNHAGTQIVMSVQREQYWILRRRKTAQRVIQNLSFAKDSALVLQKS